MPTYEFLHKETKEYIEKWFSGYTQKDEWLQENPEWAQTMTRAPGIVSGVSGAASSRVPDGFKEVLSKIGEAHPNSKVGKDYGDKSIKAVKTREIVSKHVNKITKRIEGK